MPEPAFVTDQQTLESYCQRWRDAGLLAFDTEFIRDETYDAALCLIQVSSNGQVVLIDPVADVDVTPFWELISDPNVVAIVHAGKEDFEVGLRSTGLLPHNVFDVQLAAGFVGYGYPLSLLRLVEMLLHKRIAKGQTLTDWLRRPLTDDQVRYAVEDVLHLPQIYKRLVREIDEADRMPWVREELARFEDETYYHPPLEERTFRLKGSKKLDALGLVVLERLIEWREQWAQSRNRPIRALMRDDVLVEIARRRPKKQSDVEVLRGFPQSRNRKLIRELLDVIANAAKTPKSEWPEPHRRREDSPMVKATVDLLSVVTQAICHKERLSRNLLGGAQRLRELMDYHTGESGQLPELLTGWREDFIGRRLIDVLEGQSEIRLTGWPDDPRIDVVSDPPKPTRPKSTKPRKRT